MASKRTGTKKGGKKLRRCVKMKKINDPTQKKARTASGTYGSMHKKNSPKARWGEGSSVVASTLDKKVTYIPRPR
jgi:hypothetical protein